MLMDVNGLFNYGPSSTTVAGIRMNVEGTL